MENKNKYRIVFYSKDEKWTKHYFLENRTFSEKDDNCKEYTNRYNAINCAKGLLAKNKDKFRGYGIEVIRSALD